MRKDIFVLDTTSALIESHSPASPRAKAITANSFALLGNAKLGYEVRYEECRCDGQGRRRQSDRCGDWC